MFRTTSESKQARIRAMFADLALNARKRPFQPVGALTESELAPLSETTFLRSVATANAIIWAREDAQAGVLVI